MLSAKQEYLEYRAKKSLQKLDKGSETQAYQLQNRRSNQKTTAPVLCLCCVYANFESHEAVE